MRLTPDLLPYSGLTVVIDAASRFDPVLPGLGIDPRRLVLSSQAGRDFDQSLVMAGFGAVCRDSVEVRLLSDLHEPLLPGTKCVLALGEGCVREMMFNEVTLGEQRGSPAWCRYIVDGEGSKQLPTIFSYAPQDAQDRANYFDEDGEEDGSDNDNAADVKSTHGKTARKQWRWWLRRDTMKAARISQVGLQLPPAPTYHLYPKLNDLLDVLHSTKGEDFFFDWETARDLRPTCAGFSFNAKEIFVAPLLQTHCNNTWYYGEEGTCKLLHALGVAMLNNLPVIHHAMFDLFVSAWRLRMPLPKKAFCTLLAWNRCYVEQSKSLGHVISALTDLPYHKNEGVFEPHNHEQADSLYRYNGKDVFALTQIKPAILAEAKKLGAEENIELSTREVVPYLTSSLQGMRVDWPTLHARAAHNDLCMAKMRVIINTIADFPLNPNSSQGKWSVKEYLYGKDGLGIKAPAKDPTNEKTLLQVQLTNDVPMIPWILRYRAQAKEGAFKRDDDGNIELAGGHKVVGGWLGFYPFESSPLGCEFTSPRLTTNWKLGHTVTFRRASSKLLRFTGQNLQNAAKDLRKIVIPDDGKALGQVDESGADAMIVAYLCEHGNYRDLFLNKIKPHTFLALHLFKDKWQSRIERKRPGLIGQLCLLRIQDLAKHPKWKAVARWIASSDLWESAKRYYFIAKMVIHASSYGMGPRTFRLNVLQKSEGAINLTHEQANFFLAFFHQLFPEVRAWHERVKREINRTHMLRNRFGHPRVFTSWIDDTLYREAFAYDPQSTVGQIIAYAVVELHERLIAGDELLNDAHFDFWQDGHDALLYQCDKSLVAEVGKSVQTHVNRLLVSPRGEQFNMRSSLQTGDNWGFKAH